jgi:hypothetical protein
LVKRVSGASSTYDVCTKAISVQKHYVERNGEAVLASCPIDFVSPETPPLTPPSTENNTPELRRRSGRLVSHPTKRSYVAMQGTNSGAGKHKRLQLAGNEPEVKVSAPSQSAPNGPPVETSIMDEPTIDNSITKPAIDDSNKTEASKALVNDVYGLCADENLSRSDVNTTMRGDEIIGQQIEGDLHTMTHDDGMAILDEYFPNSPVG